jgi:hypothetical protein
VGNRFASAKNSIAQCDRCGQRFKLTDLKKEIIKTKLYDLKVCPACWDPDQPQLQLGMYPVDDPQAVRDPRPDNTYYQAGRTGLQTNVNGGDTTAGVGYVSVGSRIFEWGWAPVGGSSGFDRALTPNALVATGTVNSVTISTT